MEGFQQLSLTASVHICNNIRQADVDCLRAVLGGFNADAFAVDRYRTDGPAWAFYQDGVPVCMGGIALVTPWVGIAWLVSAEGISWDSWKKIIRHTRTVMKNASQKIQRIEAHVLASWTDAIKYTEAVGFELSGVKRMAAAAGVDVLEYEIIGGLDAHN